MKLWKPLSAALQSPQRGKCWSQPEEQEEQMGGSEAGGEGRPDCRWLEAGQKDGQGWHNILNYPFSRTRGRGLLPGG